MLNADGSYIFLPLDNTVILYFAKKENAEIREQQLKVKIEDVIRSGPNVISLFQFYESHCRKINVYIYV